MSRAGPLIIFEGRAKFWMGSFSKTKFSHLVVLKKRRAAFTNSSSPTGGHANVDIRKRVCASFFVERSFKPQSKAVVAAAEYPLKMSSSTSPNFSKSFKSLGNMRRARCDQRVTIPRRFSETRNSLEGSKRPKANGFKELSNHLKRTCKDLALLFVRGVLRGKGKL